MSEWKPISEAPKDRRPVLIAERIATGSWVVVEAYRDGRRGATPEYLRTGSYRDDEFFDVFTPSHFQFLPPPPEGEA